MNPLANTKVLTFRMDSDSAEAMRCLAAKRDLSMSDFLRGVVEKVVAPAQREQEAEAAAIKALPPKAREKALRALVIQKRLRELKADRPKVHVLSGLFHDGSGAAQDAETLRLEAELAALGKEFEAEVGPLLASIADEEKGDEAPGPRGLAVVEECAEEGEEDANTCGACGLVFTAPKFKELFCPRCGKSLGVLAGEAQDGKAQDGEDNEKTDRFLEVTGLLKSLGAVRGRMGLTFLPIDWVFGGSPVVDLFIKRLKRERDGGLEDGARFASLRKKVERVVVLRKGILELEAAKSDGAGPRLAELSAELETIEAAEADDDKGKVQRRKSGRSIL